MYIRQLLRKPSLPCFRPSHVSRRLQSRTSPAAPPPQAREERSRARLARVLDRVPRFLRPYTDGLRTAPVTHIVSFLILHELTAIIPLVGLATYFHQTNTLPSIVDAPAISAYIQKYGSYFRRKGFFGISDDTELPTVEQSGEGWKVSENGARIVVEVAVAYAFTKALLPFRLALSLWATPWFARLALVRAGSGVKYYWAKVRGR